MIAASIAHFAIASSLGFIAAGGIIAASDGGMEPLTSLIGSLGIGGILAWHLWYTTSKVIPALVSDHRTALERVTGQFAESLADERKSRKDELVELRSWIRETAACRYNTDHHVGGEKR